ncbi:MAG: site-specific DNA-methyltransferase [Anaerovoracaceae bacterium]|jgi:site-specific DNA-methyltransferase (adenine-specific)|nr:site-specific DNA-methyltransferase [Anaerovoracaceae bacterium]
MPKIKAKRNKTIDTTIDEGVRYLDRCKKIDAPIKDIQEIINTTINGDFFNTVKLLPNNSIDLLIADPPYNLTKDYHGNTFSKKKEEEYEKYPREWLTLVYPLLTEDAYIYVCCDWGTSLIIGRVLQDFFKVRNRITWQREKGRGAKANWKNGFEDIWYGTKSNNYTFNLEAVKIRKKVIAPYRVEGKPKDWQETKNGNYRDTCPSNFWDDITIPFWSMSENTAHPTQKSEKLLAKIILASSMPGDVIFDPFLGSGTTSVVAKKLGRSYLGIELNPQYCIWAEQRLEKAQANTSIQGYVDGVFWDRNSLSEQNAFNGNENGNLEKADQICIEYDELELVNPQNLLED